MLEILTPLAKCIRVTRNIDIANFTAVPGLWAWMDTDGSIKDQVATTVQKINKIVMTSATDNIYESHDIEAGRITTLEGPLGLRFRVDTACFTGTPNPGDDLVVCVDAGKLGMLAALADVTQAGTYEVVARAEQISAGNWMIAEMRTGKTLVKS
jgi:hypothetical protein